MRPLLLTLAVSFAACSSPPSGVDSGTTGGGGGGGTSAGGGSAGGGSGSELCVDPAATCASHGAQCGQATLDCGRIDCGTCSIGSVTSPGGTPYHLVMAGLQRGVVVATGDRFSVSLLVPQDAGAPGYDGGYAALRVPDAGADTGAQMLSVAAAPDGTVWVGYVIGNPSTVYVASSANGFAPQPLGEGGSVALTVDSQGEPRVAFHGSAAQSGMFEARRDGGGWVKSLADPAGRSGVGAGIAVDSQGRSHLLYVTNLNGAVSHAAATAAGYSVEPVWPGTSFNDFHRAALSAGSGDELHAVWTSGDGQVVYGHRGDGGWVTSTVPRRATTGASVNVASRGGHAQLAFADDDFANYAVPIGDAGFAIQRLNRTIAERTAIAVDGQGTVHVASVDNSPTGMGLKIWRFTGKYPDGYADRIQQIAQGLCSKARDCLRDAGTYCVKYSYGDSCSAPFSSCVGGMVTNLWSVTVDAGLVDACLTALPSATCGPVGSGARPGAIAPAACDGLPF